MKWAIALVFLSFAGTVVAADDVVCVRNYLKGGYNVCETFPKEYVYLVNADPDALFETCARKRTDGFCSMAPDNYVWVVSKAKEKVCVQRFDTSIVNLCEEGETTDNYAYVKAGG